MSVTIQKPVPNEYPAARTQPELPMPIIALAIALAMLGAGGFYLTQFYPLVLAFIPLLICAWMRPQVFLILAVAVAPFTVSLVGETRFSSGLAAFGLSDLLLFLTLPGLLVRTTTRFHKMSMGKLGGAVLAFLAACLISFLYNIPLMNLKGGWLAYSIGFLRTAQIVLILPLAYLAIDWKPQELRNIVRSYLYGTCTLGIIGISAFAMGARQGLYVFGNHKNGSGLALAFGALIGIAALTQPARQETDSPLGTPPIDLNIKRNFLLGATALCLIGLICSLSRSSFLCLLTGLLYLSIVRKRGRIFGFVLAAAALTITVLMVILPEKSVEYVTDISTKNRSGAAATRLESAGAAMKRFQENPLLGDGLRSRKDILPHNLEVTLLSENGLLGTAIFVWVLICQARVFQQGRRIFREDPLREWICISFAACSIAMLTQSQFDPYWRRGPLWIPWLGTGVILAMLNADQRLRQRQQKAEVERTTREIWAKRAQRALGTPPITPDISNS